MTLNLITIIMTILCWKLLCGRGLLLDGSEWDCYAGEVEVRLSGAAGWTAGLEKGGRAKSDER